MLFKFKKNSVKKKVIEQLNNVTFNYQLAENYQLEKQAAITMNNSYYFCAHSIDKKQSLIMRLENRVDYSEVWFYYSEGNNKYFLEQTNFTANPPLKIYNEEGIWYIRFSGVVKKNQKDQVRCTIDAQFSSSKDPIDYLTQTLPERFAIAIAQENWNIEDYKALDNKDYVSYEQVGTLNGKMLLEGQHSNFNIPCFRNHSYGKKDWNYLNNHLKLVALNENGSFSFAMNSNPKLSLFETGNYNYLNDNYKVFSAKYERATLLRGTSPENLNIYIELDNKNKIGIHIKKLDEIIYYFQEGDYMIVEGIAEFLIEGRSYRGIIETGFNKDRMRWFNNKNIEKIRG